MIQHRIFTVIAPLVLLFGLHELNAFGAPHVIASVAVGDVVHNVLNKITGDSVAIGIINNFGTANLIKYGDPYIAEGYSVPTVYPVSRISPGTGGIGGGYEDRSLNWGGTQGLVRYKVTDPNPPQRTYCVYILWSQYGFYCTTVHTKFHSINVYFDGFGIAINQDGCTESQSTVYSNWESAVGNCYETTSGSDYSFGNGNSVMQWQSRSTGSSLTINSLDSKVTIHADMNPDAAKSTIAVEIGPYGWASVSPPFDYIMITSTGAYIVGLIIIFVLIVTAYNTYKLMTNHCCNKVNASYSKYGSDSDV